MIRNISRSGKDTFLTEAFVYHMRRGRFELLEKLIDQIDLSQATDNYGNNVLHHAIACRDFRRTKLFFDHNPMLMFDSNDQGITPCHMAVEAALDDPKSDWLGFVVPDSELHPSLPLLAGAPHLTGLYMAKTPKVKTKTPLERKRVAAGIRMTLAYITAYRNRHLRQKS